MTADRQTESTPSSSGQACNQIQFLAEANQVLGTEH